MIFKLHLVAKTVGSLNSEIIGMNIVVKDTNDQSKSSFTDEYAKTLVHEVKRSGLLVDRYVDLELRKGDQLVLYIQRANS